MIRNCEERPFLCGPHGPVQGKGMEKDDGETGSMVAVADCDAVDLGVHAFLSRAVVRTIGSYDEGQGTVCDHTSPAYTIHTIR